MTVTRVDSEAPGPDKSSPSHSTAAAHVAVWGFVFLILRVFAVSGYDWETAFAVSTTLGLEDGLALLFGSLMGGHLLTSILLACILPLLIAAYLWGPSGRRPTVMLLTTLGLVILVGLVVSFHSWWLPLAAATVLGLLALTRGLPPHNRLRDAATATMARVGWVVGLGVLLVAAFVQTPWVPQEQIRTTDGTIVGYVLSVDSGYLNVLTDERTFLILPSSNILSRR